MAHTRLWILILLAGLNSCTKKEITGETYNSPSGQYILQVEIGDKENPDNKYEIRFRLFDHDGDELDITGTRASAVMNYAVFWDTDDTITLYSSDIGVRSWFVTSEDKLRPGPVDYKLEKKAEEIFNKKMGR
jgi:hypothetical protein